MKKLIKISLIVFLSLFLFSCGSTKPAYQDPIKKPAQQVKDYDAFFKLEKKIMENKLFLDNLHNAQFFIENGLSIEPKSFDPYIDQNGVFTFPRVKFDLIGKIDVSYIGTETWKDQNNREYTGFVYQTKKTGHKLMFMPKFTSGNKNYLYLSLIEHEGERFKLQSATTALLCKMKQEVKTITIE